MRRKEIAFIVLILTLLVLVSAGNFECCKPPKIASVGVNLIPQHRDWWCWAATTEMISEYYDHKIDQCNSVNYVHGSSPDCCTGCTGDCPCWGDDWGATIDQIKDNWTHWDFEYRYVSSSLPWEDDTKDDVKEIISPTRFCMKSPIQVVWWYYPIGKNGGHVITAYGYAEIGADKYIAYFNPLPEDCEKDGNQCKSVSGGEDVVSTYDAFVDDGVHQWGYSFYDFEYTGP